jgi:glycosyltransferase involved in cell wall biosynthesis
MQFYNQASVVLNLSDKTQFVETFGLTALEAMSAGLPVIVPTEGGIAEMVENGVNGYKIDVQNLNEITHRIQTLFNDKCLYVKLSENAYHYSLGYSEEKTINQIIDILNS